MVPSFPSLRYPVRLWCLVSITGVAGDHGRLDVERYERAYGPVPPSLSAVISEGWRGDPRRLGTPRGYRRRLGTDFSG